MATVDLERWKIEMEHWKKQGYWPANGEPFPTSPQGGLWHDCTWAMRLDALIRRVEGLEKRILYVLKCPDSNLCRTCIVQLNEALKEEPDSVG